MRTLILIITLMVCANVNAVNDIPEKGQDTLFKPIPDQTIISAPDSTDEVTAVDESTQVDLIRLKVDNEFKYIAMLCVLSITSLTIVLFFLRNRNPSAKDIVNITGLNLIIFATIILVLVVNTSEQLTAAIGILGAIAGYLFRSVQDQNESGGK